MDLNDSLPAFNLKGTDGHYYKPEFEDGFKALVIIFFCNHCPYAQAWVGRICELVEKYQGMGVEFFAINSNDAEQYPEDAFENMPEMAEQLNLPGRYLHDDSQDVAKAFDAERTPEVFVFNKEKKLVYRGAIDDNYHDPKAVEAKYLEDAIEALLRGSEIPVRETQAVGCTIKWKRA